MFNKKTEETKKLEKEYKKKLNQITFRFIKNPTRVNQNLRDLENLLEEMVQLKLITKEEKEKQLKKLYKEMNSPQQFKEWLAKKKDKIKNKLKRFTN